MTQVQRLNLKFTVKDVDFIVGLAKAGRTAEQICIRVAHDLGTVSVQEIQSICSESGVKVRALDLA